MQNIPKDIEQKLDQLPIIPFEQSEDFQRVLMSTEFDAIFNYYMANFSNEKIKNQSEIYQRISLYLHLTNQSEEYLEQADDLLYIRPVPTIEEFLDNNFYLGLQSGTMYPYWRKKLCEIFAPNSIIKRVLWSGCTGSGKSLDKNCIIPTPTGYRKVGDIKVGEYLWGKNGKPTKVLGVYDQGIRPMCKISFDDGTFVRCDEEHLWEVINHDKKDRKNVRTTKWLMEHKLRKPPKADGSGSLFKYGIDYCQPVEYEEKHFLIEPYLLGVLIGDGCLCQYSVEITNHIKDIEIIDKCTKLLPHQYQLIQEKNGNNDTYHYRVTRKNKDCLSFKKFIEPLGLNGHKCNTKFIPKEYLLGSVEQRLELLRGLMDTDGSTMIRKSINAPTTTRFDTTSKQLAEDVMELVRSLGGRATLSIQDRREKKEFCNFEEYSVRIWMNLNPFSLKRKADLFKPRIPKKKIVSVEPDGEADAQCFYVEAEDHLYLCNSYIVTHNTVTARKAVIYSLYKLFCLRHPRAVLKVEEGSTLAVFILSVTQKTAEQTNFNPLLQILRNMPCFQEVRSMTSFENFDISNPRCPIPYYVSKSDLTIHFVNNIILTVGSQISNTVGYDIVISAADEVNEKGVEEGMELLNSIDGRLDSRFSGSSFTFQNVMSSARSTASVTREYNKKWQHDPTFLYLSPMRFEVKQGAEFAGDGNNFPVLIGNGMIPSSIITDPGVLEQIKNNTYIPPTGCEIVQVPDIYRPLFEADLEQQIQDTLGIDTKDTQSVFRDTTMLEDNRLLPELHMEANLGDNSILSEHLPRDLIIKRNEFNDKEELSRAPNALRYCHCDLSTSGGQCDTGICMLHKEWKLNPITRQKDTIYVIDILLYITAKNKIDLNAVQKLMTDLVTEYKYPIHTISTDQYQSELMRQNWIGTKCFKKVAKVSVDAKLEPYTNAAGLIEDGKVKVGKCPKLIKELEALVIQGGKVERTTELKDLADAIVGAIYDAQSNYDDFPQYEYKDEFNFNKTDYVQHFEELGQTLVAI